MNQLAELLLCPDCQGQPRPSPVGDRLVCNCGRSFQFDGGLLHYADDPHLDSLPEVETRNRQSAGYLAHSKFPTQIWRTRQFLDGLPAWVRSRPVVELGCGPGPYTPMLLARGFEALAVDFSERSLLANLETCRARLAGACFVKADVRSLRLRPACTNLLLMCDFLQHLGGEQQRRELLRISLDWLAPGGYFYLSFFNFNVVNFLKQDRVGHFASGTIPYERLLRREVIAMLPPDVLVDAIVPMNIFNHAGADRLAARLPGAAYLARMIALSGRRAAHG